MANCVRCGRQLPGLSFGKKICQWCVQHEAAQRGEDSPVQRVEAAPWVRRQSSSMVVTQAIFGANVAVFLGMSLAVGVTLFGDPAWQALAVRLGANFGPYTVRGEWWRLLTYVFIHGGLVHIAFNMWCLWNLGNLAESLYGHWTFAVVYLITGAAGGIGSLLWNPGASSVGASGAIFGLAGALIASFYLGEFSLPRSALGGTLRSLGTFVVVNLFLGGAIAGIDNAAHVGGLVMGLLLGAYIAKVAPAQDDFARRLGVLLVGVVIIGSGILWLDYSSSYLVHAQNGVELLTRGKTDEAILELKKATSMRPDFAATHGALARAYVVKRDYDNAAAEMKRLIALSPSSESPYYQLGLIYLEQGRPAQAQDVFTQLIKINANSANGHAGMAAAYADQKKYAEALEEYKRVATLDPDYQGLYFNTGLAQARLNLLDDAIASLLKQRQNGDDPDNENTLADVYQAKGMTKEAADARQRAAAFQGKQ